MAWITTKTGKHIDTDWFDKENQIAANAKAARMAETGEAGSSKEDYERSPKMDFIEKRIEGKKAEIAKLEKKMQRIKEAEATNWQKNPYYYGERDLRITGKELEKAKEGLKQYEEDLQKEISKAKSRNVPVITEFLNTWKDRSIEYFIDQKKRYDQAYKEMRETSTKFDEEYRSLIRAGKRDEAAEVAKADKKVRNKFNADWLHVTQFYAGSGSWEENMRKEIERERIRKYDDLIYRTNDLIGEITDAGGLRVGKAGDLNGVIRGKNGSVTIQTIGAGGYNIQRYHFRTLINKFEDAPKQPEPKITTPQIKTIPASSNNVTSRIAGKYQEKGFSTQQEVQNYLKGLSPTRRNRIAKEMGIEGRGEEKLQMMAAAIFAAFKK